MKLGVFGLILVFSLAAAALTTSPSKSSFMKKAKIESVKENGQLNAKQIKRLKSALNSVFSQLKPHQNSIKKEKSSRK